MNISHVNIILDLGALLVLTVIWFTDKKGHLEMRDSYLFRSMMVSISTILGSNAVIHTVLGYHTVVAWYFALFATSVYFITQAVFCWQWFLLAKTRFSKRPPFPFPRYCYLFSIPLVAEFIIIAFINPFTGIVFEINETLTLQKGPFYYWNILFSYVYIVVSFILIILTVVRDKNRPSRKKNEILLFVMVAPIISSFVQVAAEGVSILWPITALSVYLLYEIEGQHFLEFNATKQAELEAELAKNKIAIMMSQIQPHFLYNTLTTIKALIGQDPAQAQTVITEFSSYLRTNMDSLDLTTPVDFIKELEHTKTYTKIEQLRFPDLEVEYDINDTNFQLPSLSVQPMVENAIKHGIRKRTEPGGKVIIRSYTEDDHHVVQIIDNGTGFSSLTSSDTTRSHIGLVNTKRRIEEMMHGAFYIDSTPNVGTTITFVIPDTDDEE
ncbi:MAG: histidine kinase [Lachnospiraceae bacterium]|nr:histidine kinase [Lachnospiraceae bacterium]